MCHIDHVLLHTFAVLHVICISVEDREMCFKLTYSLGERGNSRRYNLWPTEDSMIHSDYILRHKTMNPFTAMKLQLSLTD